MTAGVGKAMRLKRVIDPKGVSVICALDHGMTSPTFLEPLSDIAARTAEAVRGGANVIMMSRGMVRIAEPAFSPTTSLALLLSASANPDGTRPAVVQVAEVEEAARLGADAVVLFTALGGDGEPGMIRTLAGVGRECASLGMPLIAEAEFPTTPGAYGFPESSDERRRQNLFWLSPQVCVQTRDKPVVPYLVSRRSVEVGLAEMGIERLAHVLGTRKEIADDLIVHACTWNMSFAARLRSLPVQPAVYGKPAVHKLA